MAQLVVDGGDTFYVPPDIAYDNEIIGDTGQGTLDQTGGTNAVTNDLILGNTVTGGGTYNLSDGSLSAAHEIIGNAATGVFTHTGGTNTVPDLFPAETNLILGNQTTGSGTYTLSGSGSLSTPYGYIGYNGTGVFTQDGGTHESRFLRLGYKSSGSGSYSLASGSLVAPYTYVGYRGSGSFTQTGGTLTGELIYLGAEEGSQGTYTLSDGDISVLSESIGRKGPGTFTQSGGDNEVENLTVGRDGTYNMSGGRLEVERENIVVRATFSQSGGYHSAINLIMGKNQGGKGTYELSGSGSFGVSSGIIGDAGIGVFTQTGGHFGASSFYPGLEGFLILGNQATGSGTFELSGSGEMGAQKQYIGKAGTGLFIQTGGSNRVPVSYPLFGILILGDLATGRGTYILSGGSLSTPAEFIGDAGTGEFIQTGGTHTVLPPYLYPGSEKLILGTQSTGSGTYTLSGGCLSTAVEVIGNRGTGLFSQSGGTHTVSDTLTLADQVGSCGIYELQGGSLSAGTVILNQGGLFTQTGGTLNATNFHQEGGEVQGSLQNQGTFTYDSGTFTGRLLNYGAVVFNNDFTAGNGLAQYSATPITLGAGRNITLNGDGLTVDQGATFALQEGGSLWAEKEIIGGSGAGIFSQSDGTNTINTGLHLGDKSTGRGTYELRGGSLLATGENVGNEGVGSFIQDGGTNSMDHLVLGTYSGGIGTYNLNNGSLSVAENEIIGALGTGTFIQSGGTNAVAQDLIIGGGSGSTGLYKLLGGTLLADTVQVNPGGTFLGAGSLRTQFINRNVLDPGTSVGVLNIIGSYTQDPNGTLKIEIESPTSFDQLKVSGTPGTATLNGRLQPVLLKGFRLRGNTVFRQVITATGGITGTFNIIGNGQLSPTLFWQGIYHPTSFDLVVKRDYTNPSLGLSSNQRAVGRMLNSVANTTSGGLNQVLSTIDFLPSAGAVRQAYQQISPEKATPLPELGLAAAILQQRSLARRITDLRFGSRDLAFARGFPGFLSLFGSRGAGGIMLAYNGADLTGMVPARQEAIPEKSWGVFLDPVVIIGSQGSSDDQTGYDYTLAGFTLGVDRRLGKDLLVGLATGYSHNSAVFRGTGGNITNNTWPITAYAAYLPERGYAFASLGYSLNLFNLEREISFGSINRTAKGNTTGHQFNLYAEAGYDLKSPKIKPVVVTPALSLAYSTISVDSFTEENAGALNLKVDGQKPIPCK